MSLEITDLAKHYGAVVAIKKANLSIQKGEIRALLGGNGSGKSTLAKVVGGVIDKNFGTIKWDGKPINYKSPGEAKNNSVIITSQELSLFPNLNVSDNICICNLQKKALIVDKKMVIQKAKEVLLDMELDDILDTKISDLPPNKQYMVELAKAIVQEPKVFIIDEITSALYKKDVVVVHQQLMKLKEKGCIILFISHRMDEIYNMCDSVTVMRNGETICTHNINEKTEVELLSLMAGRKITLNDSTKTQNKNFEKIDDLVRIENIPIESYSSSINLTIKKGEIIGIAGLQGHGQRDLLRALYGLDNNSNLINYKFEDKELSIFNSHKAVLNKIAFISGDREKEGTFSEGNLTRNLNVVISQVLKKTLPSSVDNIFKSFGIKYDSTKQKITELSGGNQQKIIVARWLISNPLILIADDPTKGIDVTSRMELHQEFIKLAKSGSSVIYLSSDDEELVNLTSLSNNSRVIVMYEGKVSAELKYTDITAENISAASMPLTGDNK